MQSFQQFITERGVPKDIPPHGTGGNKPPRVKQRGGDPTEMIFITM